MIEENHFCLAPNCPCIMASIIQIYRGTHNSGIKLLDRTSPETTTFSIFASLLKQLVVENPESRRKNVIPDIGAWLCILLLDVCSFYEVANSLIAKVNGRNAFWNKHSRSEEQPSLDRISHIA